MNETSPLPQESDKEHAALSRVSYDLGKTIDGWIRKQEFDDPRSGFRAAIFQRENSDEYVLAYAGTDFSSFADLKTDARQALGFDTKQYQQAADTALYFQEKYSSNGAKLSLAGHSLGGGEAILGSAVTGLPAVVINPAGVHDNTLKRHDVIPEEFRKEAESGLIRNIIVEGEILDWLNGKSPAEIFTEIKQGAKQAASDKVESVVTGAIDGATGAAKVVAGKVENAAAAVGQAVNNAASYVGDAVTPVLNTVGNAMNDAATTARSAADAVGNTVSGAVDHVVEAARPVVDTVGNTAVKTAQTVGNTVKTAADATGKVVNQAASHINDTVTPVFNTVGNAVNNAANTVSTTAKSTANAVGNTVSGAVGHVVEAATPVINAVGHTAVRTAQTVGNTAKTAADTAGEAVNQAVSYVSDAVTPVLNSVGNTVSDAAGAVSTSARSAANAVGNTVKGVAGHVVEKVKPVTEKVGNAVAGVADTVTGAAKTAADAVGNTVNGVVDGVRNTAETVSRKWNTPTPASYGIRIEVQDQSGAHIGDKHRIGVAEEAIDAAINPQQRQAAMATAFKKDPAEAAKTYPELESAHQALEAVSTVAGSKMRGRAEGIIQRKLVQQIEQGKAIPTPQQAIKFVKNTISAARDLGR